MSKVDPPPVPCGLCSVALAADSKGRREEQVGRDEGHVGRPGAAPQQHGTELSFYRTCNGNSANHCLVM